MRLALSAAVIASAVSSGTAFSVGKPFRWGGVSGIQRFSTVEADAEAAPVSEEAPVVAEDTTRASEEPVAAAVAPPRADQPVIALTSAEVKARLNVQLAKLREKDATSTQLGREVSSFLLLREE